MLCAPQSLARAPAMLLAAGRGARMRPLTDTCPKPLLLVQGKPLLQWHLEALLCAGVPHAVINTAWLEEQIVRAFGHRFGPDGALQLRYSMEGRDFGGALESAGGICRALDLLFAPTPAADVFWVVASDVFAPQFDFTPELVARFIASGQLAQLWLVPNPAHHPSGDFAFDAASGLALNPCANAKLPSYTYSGIGLYQRALFAPPWCDIGAGNPHGIQAKLAPLLRAAAAQRKISAVLYSKNWTDVGTPQRLAALNHS